MQYQMPNVWFFDVGFYSIYISSLGWMCETALFWFSSTLLSLSMCVCMFVLTGRCKTILNQFQHSTHIHILVSKNFLLCSFRLYHTALDLKLIYVYFQTWNMAPLFFVYFYMNIYFSHAISCSQQTHTHTY